MDSASHKMARKTLRVLAIQNRINVFPIITGDNPRDACPNRLRYRNPNVLSDEVTGTHRRIRTRWKHYRWLTCLTGAPESLTRIQMVRSKEIAAWKGQENQQNPFIMFANRTVRSTIQWPHLQPIPSTDVKRHLREKTILPLLLKFKQSTQTSHVFNGGIDIDQDFILIRKAILHSPPRTRLYDPEDIS